MVGVEGSSGVVVLSSLKGVLWYWALLSSLRILTLLSKMSEGHFPSLSQARHNSSPLHKGQEQEEVRHFLEKLISHCHFSSSPASCQASSQWGLESGTWAMTTTILLSCLSPPLSLILTLGFHRSLHVLMSYWWSMSTQSFTFHLKFLLLNDSFQAKWILQWCCHIHSQTACPILTVSCFI